MNELLSLLWGFIVGAAIAWLILKLVAGYLRAKNEVLKKELEVLNKNLKEKFISCDIEKHGEVFYLFEKETDRFIAQGRNMDELKQHCDSRFKTQIIVADNEQLEKFGLK